MTARTRTIGSLSFTTVAAFSHHTFGLIVGAAVLVLTALVPVLTEAIAELFWLKAQSMPSRSLRRVCDHAGSVREVERLMRLLLASQRDVLDARTEASRGEPKTGKRP